MPGNAHRNRMRAQASAAYIFDRSHLATGAWQPNARAYDRRERWATTFAAPQGPAEGGVGRPEADAQASERRAPGS